MTDGVNERFDFTAEPTPLAQMRAAHLIAIGGSGMSGVGRLLLARGVRVSGSDNVDLPVLEDLRSAGAAVTVGYSAQTARNLPDDVHVVVSSAIHEDNPELAEVRSRGLPVLHRAQALGMLMSGAEGIAVAGTNGKTTTSAMTVVALRACGSDPSFAIGAPIVGIGANSAVGQGSSFVVEADESDGSFVVYRPRIALVTNVKDDHLDFYGSSETMRSAYAAFARTIREGGLLVACGDDAGSAELAETMRAEGRRVATYGHADSCDLQIRDERGAGLDWSATLRTPGGAEQTLQLAVPGVHNLLNAAGVLLALTEGLGREPDQVLAGLRRFAGTSRRFEPRGEAAGVRVVDDYAHNPGKLEAVIRTGLALRDGGRLIVLFQPHLYSRTRQAADGLAQALDLADIAVVMDVYGAREAPVPGVSGRLISDRLAGGDAAFAADREEAVEKVLSHARPGDLVLTVGAGDVTQLGPVLLDRLARR